MPDVPTDDQPASAEATRPTLRQRARRAQSGLLNIAKLVSGNRFTQPYQTHHVVVQSTRLYSLRHYQPGVALRSASASPQPAPVRGGTVLLVPPLMVTAEVYDIAPELSLVLWLCEQGHDVWLIDFGIPGQPLPGANPDETPHEKDLVEHILALDAAIDEIVARTTSDVHLVGYSQGGMFAYQAAAYRRCKGVASLVTMGSPVDFLRNLPGGVHSGIWANMFQAGADSIRRSAARLPKVSGRLSSLAFKIISPRQELKHMAELLRFLDDEDELKRIEPARRFLGGEGFIPWPGPALRAFVEEFIVHNRLMNGGLVIAGRTASLADISVPVLYFVGGRDQVARADSVRAIEKVLPHDACQGVVVDTGHLGLVVGTRAKRDVYPRVNDWIHALSQAQSPPPPPPSDRAVSRSDVDSGAASGALGPVLQTVARTLWLQLGRAGLSVSGTARWSRWQVPHLAKLGRFWDRAPLSLGRLLDEQARALPNQTFLLWEDRAYTYAEANQRVTRIAAALHHAGIRPEQPIGLMMDNHPDCLTALAAVSRLGAVAVLLNPALRGAALAHAIQITAVRDVIVAAPSYTHPDLLGSTTGDAAASALRLRRLFLGSPNLAPTAAPTLAAGDVDLERLDATWPNSLRRNPARASEVACLMFTSGTTGKPKAARITNRRFLFAATAASAGCALTPTDTVYCCLPLHHATGLILAAGGALVAGSRLAIAPRFSTSRFWQDVRRTGSTVVFYVGELCRYLVSAPPSALEKTHAVRLFVGNGMRADVWRQLLLRCGPTSVLEFYGATEGNGLLVNLTGEKIGSVGRVPFGLVDTLLAQYDPVAERPVRGDRGLIVPAAVGQPGMLLVEIASHNPLSQFDGYTDDDATAAKILRNVRRPGDAWFESGDLLREDADGDYWFVDRVGDTFRWKGENVSTEQVGAVLSQLPAIAMCTVYGVHVPGHEGRAGMAAVTLRPGAVFDPAACFDLVDRHLVAAAQPRFLRIVPELPTTETLKVKKQTLLDEGIDLARTGPLYVYDRPGRTYRLVTSPLELVCEPL